MTIGLFAGYGIELEYMIVDRETLAVRPIVDQLMQHFAGVITGDHEDGPIAWSNELALHVVELKTNGPAPALHGLAQAFHTSLLRIEKALSAMGAMLLPGGMHPTMDPRHEFRRWTHDYGDVYGAYDRIFDCRGHGWSNLQSCHLNLPFADDEQFGRLHLAARALMPLLPAIAASSPFCEGRYTGWLDWRLQVYRHNQARVPRIAGLVVPEPVTTRARYFTEILEPIWRDIAPLDPDHLLREEWLNSRGVVAKFFRDALEIRVLDVQECPAADLAICALVVAVTKALCEQRWCDSAALAALPTEELATVLWTVARQGDQATIAHPGLLRALGLSAEPRTALEVWRALAEVVLPDAGALDPLLAAPLHTVLERGPLARRMMSAVGTEPDRAALESLQRQLAECLRTNTSFG
ncbi:MAG TPA: glutamate-cysteine ligase family protein [Planctomycetota bacterium]|nr:glutamate-cysteine ligase family protein [Planctomycetota bacterium]